MYRRAVVARALVGGLLTLAAAVPVTTSASDEHFLVSGPVECCEPAVRRGPPEPPAPPSDPLFVVGDSLFVGVVSPLVLGASNTLQATLRADGRTVFTSARSGRRVPEGIDVVQAQAETVRRASAVLIGLGTNDLFGSSGGSVERARRRIDEMIEALRSINPDVRIIWTDVSVEQNRTRTENWNTALVAVATDTANVEVCRWRDIVLQHPEWVAGDRIHLNTSGYRARRDVLIQCVLERSP